MKRGINNWRELVAALACYWMTGLLVYMICNPADFTIHVMEILPW
jgi:hypothetical protein